MLLTTVLVAILTSLPNPPLHVSELLEHARTRMDGQPCSRGDPRVQCPRQLHDGLRGEVGGRVPPWDDATARAFQVILQERGLYRGAIDGIIGPGSRAGAAALDD